MDEQRQSTGPRTVEIYSAVNRPNLLLGCEREPVLGLGLLCALLVMGVMTAWAFFTALLAWSVGVYVLRQMAKADPIMTRVYSRHRRYAAYYPSRPRWTGRQRDTSGKWIK